MAGDRKQKKLIERFYEENPESILSPFTYQGHLNERGQELFSDIELSSATVLDVGCGFGHTLGHCREQGADAVGVDLAESVIEQARDTYPDIAFYVDDVDRPETPALTEWQYDVVISFEVIEHTADWRTTISRLIGRLRPGGTLVLSCPNYFNTAGALKLVFDALSGERSWSPFLHWKRQAHESFITYRSLITELEQYVDIYQAETVDILRGVCPFAYYSKWIDNRTIVRWLRRALENRRRRWPLRCLGSNVVIKATRPE